MRKWSYMRFGSLVMVFSLCLAAASLTPMTVEKLAAFLRNAVNSTDYKYTDRDLAGFLANVKMTERLDDRAIEDLQGQMKIGPLTLVRLKMLRDQSQSLTAAKPVVAPLPPKPIPPPSSEEQAAILDEVREYALNYSAQPAGLHLHPGDHALSRRRCRARATAAPPAIRPAGSNSTSSPSASVTSSRRKTTS